MALNRIASSALSIILITATAITWSMETSTETTDQSHHQNTNTYFPSLEGHTESITLLNQMDEAPLFQNLCKIGTGNEEKCASLLDIFNRASYYTSPVRSNAYPSFSIYCENSLPPTDQSTCNQQVKVMVELLKKYCDERVMQSNISFMSEKGRLERDKRRVAEAFVDAIAETSNRQSSNKSN
jgi:hypothetical protein